MVEEQEYHHDGHERSKCQRAACCLLAFELSAVFDVVSFRQFDLCVYLGLYIIDYTSQVAVGHVGEMTILRFTFSRLMVFGPMAERISAT